MKKDKQEQVSNWVGKAKSDLKVARREIAATDPALDAVCFHFQQAVEKLLKAWLLWHEVNFPPTHSIGVLLAACRRIDPTFSELDHAQALTPYAVEVRYADSFYVPTQEEAREASEIAAQVEDFILASLFSLGFDPDNTPSK